MVGLDQIENRIYDALKIDDLYHGIGYPILTRPRWQEMRDKGIKRQNKRR